MPFNTMGKKFKKKLSGGFTLAYILNILYRMHEGKCLRSGICLALLASIRVTCNNTMFLVLGKYQLKKCQSFYDSLYLMYSFMMTGKCVVLQIPGSTGSESIV